MKKVKKLVRYTLGVVARIPLFLWCVGLYICGIVIQYKQVRKEKPYLSRTAALDTLDADAIGKMAFELVAEKIGWSNAKWGS